MPKLFFILASRICLIISNPGCNISTNSRNCTDNKASNSYFQRCILVFPNFPKYKEFASVYVDIANEKIVEDGGTDTFPYCVPRFYNTGEVYGRSPAMSAIPALRTLNMATFQYVENMRASGKPVAFVPVSIADDVDLEPGAVNPYDSSDGQVILWSKAGDISGTLNFIERIKTDIGEIFYNDVFQYLEDRKNMRM